MEEQDQLTTLTNWTKKIKDFFPNGILVVQNDGSISLIGEVKRVFLFGSTPTIQLFVEPSKDYIFSLDEIQEKKDEWEVMSRGELWAFRQVDKAYGDQLKKDLGL